MMSILGANGADMEEILKALGYQSHAISSAALKKHLLAHASTHSRTAQDIPAAECVGDQWQTMPTTTQEETSAISPYLETQSHTIDNLPAAEPVGDFAKQKRIAEEEKIVLLWRYNYQFHHNTQKKRDKSGHKWQNKPKKFSKRGKVQVKRAPEAPYHKGKILISLTNITLNMETINHFKEKSSLILIHLLQN